MLDTIIQNLRAGTGAALPSVCSAHADVLEAALRLAETLDQPLLVEATSNQVNHHGGYTGQTPEQFLAALRAQASGLGCDADRLILGGDHLGPQAWKAQVPEAAMQEARAMIAAYAAAGFTKIHLDCSEGCAGEPAQLADGPAAARAAELATVAEAHAPNPEALRFVIGTEVPPPGGARVGHEATIEPTPPDRARATIATHEAAFATAGADFARVRAIVVQPGLEFGPDHVDHFDMGAPDNLSAVLDPYPALCFEAHSTDYQYSPVYVELARRRFAILKVGPALTFAWREAAYALNHLAAWLGDAPDLVAVMDRLMRDNPAAWRGHYPDEALLLRHFGLADRIRYYWTHPEAQAAIAGLLAQLEPACLPHAMLTQYLPEATVARAEGLPMPWPRALLVAHVQVALLPYFKATPC